MTVYPFSREYVLYKLPSIEGWAYYAWAIENNPWTEVQRDSDGYIAQEMERRAARQANGGKRI